MDEIRELLTAYLPPRFPEAVMTVRPQENIFEKIFAASETPLVVEVALATEKAVPPGWRG
ncbi:MAG: hypothetical protein U5L72_10390 [Bacteroidales bacterium]|nr:hypothetical protein [Bacteroidales bacterium]